MEAELTGYGGRTSQAAIPPPSSFPFPAGSFKVRIASVESPSASSPAALCLALFCVVSEPISLGEAEPHRGGEARCWSLQVWRFSSLSVPGAWYSPPGSTLGLNCRCRGFVRVPEVVRFLEFFPPEFAV